MRADRVAVDEFTATQPPMNALPILRVDAQEMKIIESHKNGKS
jgi:hypothetical protein